MGFPDKRMRRLRRTETLRRMVRETRLSVDNLIYPMFACPGNNVRTPIGAMPGQFQLSVDQIVKDAEVFVKDGVPAVILFGIPEKKDALGTEAFNDKAPVQQAVRALKKAFGHDLVVITDVCMCEYTDHGHCGMLDGHEVLNDATLELLAKEALSTSELGRHGSPIRHDDAALPSSAKNSTKAALKTYQSWPMLPNKPLFFMVHFAKQPNRHQSLATASPIKWTQPTPAGAD